MQHRAHAGSGDVTLTLHRDRDGPLANDVATYRQRAGRVHGFDTDELQAVLTLIAGTQQRATTDELIRLLRDDRTPADVQRVG
ncbi:hypothetical protein D9M70_551810 [compost metagenome]